MRLKDDFTAQTPVVFRLLPTTACHSYCLAKSSKHHLPYL
jgi:hypothetical protein